MSSSLLHDVRFVRFDLSNANLTSATLAYADLRSVDFSNADLTKADLNHANLGKADLRWANLTDADLSEADVEDALFSDADLNRTNLSKVELSKAVVHNPKNLDRARNVDGAELLKVTAEDKQEPRAGEGKGEVQKEDSAPGGDDGKTVKIWGLQLEHAGMVQHSFKDEKELSCAFDGLSEIEANMVKHRMFAEGEVGVPGRKGTVIGVLYSVNFMPGNQEIPITIKWLNPDRKVVASQSASSGYCRRQVTSHTLTSDAAAVAGPWLAEFYYENRKIGSQEINVIPPEKYEERLKRWTAGGN
jgi:hypothetical protein